MHPYFLNKSILLFKSLIIFRRLLSLHLLHFIVGMGLFQLIHFTLVDQRLSSFKADLILASEYLHQDSRTCLAIFTLLLFSQ